MKKTRASATRQRQLFELVELLTWQDAAANDGHGPDADLIYWQLEMK